MTEPRKPKKTESAVEAAKRDSKQLRGTIGETLASEATHFGADDLQLLKFHGVYQQDDRDTRTERKRGGLEPDYFFMVRVAIPGGRLTAKQYLALDELADVCGNGTLRITTRQGLQFHRVPKGDLQTLITGVNARLLTTLAACGDVERNVMASPAPLADPAHRLVQQMARDIAQALSPGRRAYHEIWLGGEKLHTTEEPPDPLYGRQYLPRKFKTGIALAGDNSVDIYAHDAGLVALLDDGEVTRFQLLAGGGLGMTHNKPDTFAALALPIGVIPAVNAVKAVRAVVGIFRDHGNRADRKHARLKYLIDEWGLDRFREEFRSRVAFDVAPPVELPRADYHDYLGRHAQGDGKFFYGVFIENGRVADVDGTRVRSAFREVVRRLQPAITFTPSQNILFTDLGERRVDELESILRDHGVRLVSQLRNARRYSMACPALPTCGLALTEAERVMPNVIDMFERELAALGLEDERLTIRMTGCPNGCARPYTADIGVVGRKPGERYNVYLGGGLHGDRMTDLFAADVPIGEVFSVLRPLLAAFAAHRQPRETFSDFYVRVAGHEAPRTRVTGGEVETRNSISLPVIS